MKTVDIIIGQDQITSLPGAQFNASLRKFNEGVVENQPNFSSTVITDLTNNGLNDYGIENDYTKAISNMILSRKNAFICTGSNSNYILTTNTAIINSKLAIYENGMELSFITNHINTGASTINIDGLGAVPLVTPTNTPLLAGDLNGLIDIKYNSAGYFMVMSQIGSNSTSSFQKKFSVNSGSVSSGNPNFISNPVNSSIRVSGTTTPLVYTFANGNTQEQTTNIDKTLNQNGSFIVYKDNLDVKFVPTLLNLIANTVKTHNTLYKPLNQVQNGTVNFTNGSNVLNNLVGINNANLAVGQTITSLIAGLATGFLIACNRTNGSPTLTNVNTALWNSIFIGQVITGTGIPANTRIIAFNNTGVIATSTITLSNNATSTGTQQPTLSANPKITSFTATTITLDLPCTATTTNSAIQIHEDIILSTSYFKAGMAISGTNIPANSTITSIDTINNAIIMNNNATATTTAVSNVLASQRGFYESTTQPTGNDDELWININPLKSFKKISGVWTAYNFVNLGEVVKSNGVIGSITNYAYNGMAFGEYSPTIPAGGNVVVNDNIGRSKQFCRGELYAEILTSTDANFVVGGIYKITSYYSPTTEDLLPIHFLNKNQTRIQNSSAFTAVGAVSGTPLVISTFATFKLHWNVNIIY